MCCIYYLCLTKRQGSELNPFQHSKDSSDSFSNLLIAYNECCHLIKWIVLNQWELPLNYCDVKKTNLVAVAFKDYFPIISKQAIFYPGLLHDIGEIFYVQDLGTYRLLKPGFQGCNS